MKKDRPSSAQQVLVLFVISGDEAQSFFRQDKSYYSKSVLPIQKYGGRRSGEEVYRYQLRYMITKESTPGLRRRLQMADHVFGDRGFGHTNAKHL